MQCVNISYLRYQVQFRKYYKKNPTYFADHLKFISVILLKTSAICSLSDSVRLTGSIDVILLNDVYKKNRSQKIGSAMWHVRQNVTGY